MQQPKNKHRLPINSGLEKTRSQSLFFQPKLTINQPNDIYEQEADAVAERVIRMQDKNAELLFFQPKAVLITPVQKKCATCEQEEKLQRNEDEDEEPVQMKSSKDFDVQRKCSHCLEEEKVQLKGESHSGDGMGAPSIVYDVINTIGQPIDITTRSFMESRFGYDFSDVQIHNDSRAHQSSREINALAYTHGDHIVFGKGNYQINTNAGKKLLAHELTHVLQQDKSSIRRMTIGKGKPPNDLKDEVMEIPEADLGRINAAIKIIEQIAKDPDRYSSCHQSFKETCPNGTRTSLLDAFNIAVLWRRKPGPSRAGASTFNINGNFQNVAYTQNGFDSGTESLAFDLFHELGHVCGISFIGQPHFMTDKLTLYCLGPSEKSNDTQLSFGFGRSGENWSLLLSYGWLIHEWRGGRIGLKTNLSFDALGALRALQDLSGEKSGGGTVADLTLGLKFRPFSGQRFGGLSFNTGLGVAGGGYKIRPPVETDPEEIRYGAAFVAEAGTRIDWWVKDEDAITDSGEIGRVKPRSLDLTYKYIRPFSAQAKASHQLVLGYTIFF